MPAKVSSDAADGARNGATGRLVNIIDIRRASVETSLRDEIVSLFAPKVGPRTLPTLLLYDEKGLQLFEEVGLLSPC